MGLLSEGIPARSLCHGDPVTWRGVNSGRRIGTLVESRMGAVAWGLWPTPRFPPPLIKPGVPISGTRLSDWLHRKAHDGRPLIAGVGRRHLGTSSPSSRAFSEGSGSYQALSGSSPITFTSPSSKAHQKSGPFAPPALPGINAPIAPSDSRRDHRLMR